MKKTRICLLVACALLVASCGGSSASVDTSGLTGKEKEWVDFSYAHEKNSEARRKWEQLPAKGVKSYLDQQLPRLCGDTADLMESLKKQGYEESEMREYKQKTAQLLC
ncbi:hypothetical protein ACFU8Q_35960 [Streptomyces sp. NPDC057543]|uniref:hypothetical protein n=1 Tax=Streptomyces sp. NPDC057543 TaxID=3346163 RepID=UPI0036C08605